MISGCCMVFLPGDTLLDRTANTCRIPSIYIEATLQVLYLGIRSSEPASHMERRRILLISFLPF